MNFLFPSFYFRGLIFYSYSYIIYGTNDLWWICTASKKLQVHRKNNINEIFWDISFLAFDERKKNVMCGK